MTEQKYYRSPIDKLVVESGINATLIAQYMQIKYHRMVALRRLKNVEEQDIELCKNAIAKILDDKIPYRKGPVPENLQSVNRETDSITQSVTKVRMLAQLQRERTSNLAFLLGQTLGFVQNVFDSLQVNNVPIPDKILERKKQLEEQCNKLLDINQ